MAGDKQEPEQRVLREGLQRMFENALARTCQFDDGGLSDIRPPVDILDTAEEVVIFAEVPGLKKEDLKVELKEGVLTISGEHRPLARRQHARYFRSERLFGRFARSFALPAASDADQIRASLNDGVLEIVVPKARHPRTRHVAID
jgi:HSP20 family protein